MRHKLPYVCCVHLLLTLMALRIGSCDQDEAKRRPVKYLIPEGYVGWVKISFQVANAAELPIEGNQYLVRIPETGVLKTSSQIEYGWAKDQYCYYTAQSTRDLRVTGWGGGGMIWGNFNGKEFNDNQQVQTYLQFFVGTEEQYKKNPTPPNPKPAEGVQQ